MEILKLIAQILVLSAVAIFVCYSIYLICITDGPDESQSRTRYDQTLKH